MDILHNIDTNVSTMVSSTFDDFISTKVKEEIGKGKEKFLNDLNMCEEEYPVYEENKHKKCNQMYKIVNDNTLPYQHTSRGYKLLNTEGEFVLTNIKLSSKSFDFDTDIFQNWDPATFSLTNKGNIYATNLSANVGGSSCVSKLFNFKILEYLWVSNCCGTMINRIIANGHVQADTVYTKDKFSNLPQYKNMNNQVNGLGCKYKCPGYIIKKKNGFRINEMNYSYNHLSGIHYEDGVGWIEDCIERFLTNNICPECKSGEVIPETLNPDINIEIFRNPPIFNNEYIDLLELLSNKELTIPIYQIQTIYAKYHPRANENYVIEEKLTKLTKLEETVNERVKEEKDKYSEKIKEINEEK